MELASVLLIALGLSADCLAVAISGSVAMRAVSAAQVLRTSLAFGVFQGLMPALGWLAGRTVVNAIAPYDHWVAFALLAIVGGRMVRESLHSKQGGKSIDISKGLSLVALSVATSVDALAVGLSFAFLEVDIALASAVIGSTAFVVTAIGFLLGRRAGRLVGRRAEAIGGIVLIGIGIRIVLTHTL